MDVEVKNVIGIGWTVVVDGQTKRVYDHERHARSYKRKLEREYQEKMEKEKYNCSKHGSEGHPDCEECLVNLKKLAKDKNAHLVGEEECLKK